MKIFILIQLFLISLASSAQGVKSFYVKLNYISTNEKLLPSIGPFRHLKEKKYTEFIITDTTFLYRAASVVDTVKRVSGFYEHFHIVKRSKDNLKLLVVSDMYESHSRFGMSTGYIMLYAVDLSKENSIGIYAIDFYHGGDDKSQLEVDFDHLPDQYLIITGVAPF